MRVWSLTNITDLKEHHTIKARKDGADKFSERWKLYECFVFEATLGSGAAQQQFVLFAGNWYRVDKSFKGRVEEFYAAIPKVTIFGETTCLNEEALIADIEANKPDFLKLDQVPINPGGVKYANLEACDFLSKEKQFIHLKDGHSSGPISHLWLQGVVSAEAFVSDAAFRQKLRAKVRNLDATFASLLPKADEKVVREDYTVVYGIMRKPYADGTLGIPFFSKVSLQAAAERIAQFGIPLAIELIQKPASDGAAGGAEDEDT